jgi:hypothetical protein
MQEITATIEESVPVHLDIRQIAAPEFETAPELTALPLEIDEPSGT